MASYKKHRAKLSSRYTILKPVPSKQLGRGPSGEERQAMGRLRKAITKYMARLSSYQVRPS